MAVPVVESVSTGGNADPGAGTLVINKPTGTAAGDLLVAGFSFQTASGESVTGVPAGWALSESRADAGGINSGAVYYKVAGGAEGASYTWTFSASLPAFGGIARISGVDGTTPVNIDGSSAPAAGTTQTSPTVTTTVADCLILRWLTWRRSDVTPVTPPGSHTEKIDAHNSYDSGGGVSLATISQASAGATGTANFTISSAFRECAHIVLGIAPAAGGGTGVPVFRRHYQMMQRR